ncbi:hypothetical protein ACFYWX_43445 [Streptomyces sp. NPDC002888]|uniref:hypothetical protein n=1 Tax=Streptomyces sp. NPDC002888 TaxID=3364668 RepID=UPI00368B79A2
MAEQKSAQERLPQPLRAAASTLQKVPGAGMVSRAAEGTLDRIGAVSPRGRRVAVYTGAGVLGVTGLIEWPVAATGAAVAWLTQPRPEEKQEKQEELEKAEAEGATGAGAPGSAEGIGVFEGAGAVASTAGIEGTAGSSGGGAGAGPTSAHRDAASQTPAATATPAPSGGKAPGRSGTSTAGRRKASPADGVSGSTAGTGQAG